MQKKIILFNKLLLSFLILILISGCTQDELINDSTSGEILPAKESIYQDGWYQAATKYYDENGYGQFLTILIKNKTITKVSYREFNQEGLERLTVDGNDYRWDKLSPLNLGSLYSKLYNDLLMNQSATAITTVSGASKTSETFKRLSQGALKGAIENDSRLQQIDTDVTYITKSPIDARDHQGILTATFSGEKLLKLNYDEINLQNDTLRSKSNELINDISYSDLFDSFTTMTLNNQNLNSIFDSETLTPEQEKYDQCLSILRSQRVNFNAP